MIAAAALRNRSASGFDCANGGRAHLDLGELEELQRWTQISRGDLIAAEWLNVAGRAILPPSEPLLMGSPAVGRRHLNIMINQCYKCTWRAPVRNLE
jgi:hypothetical protein